MFGPTLSDLEEVWRAQAHAPFFCIIEPWRTTTGGPAAEPEPTRTAPLQPIPRDDPQSPASSPLAGAWQCPGCGTIYSFMVNKCECQKRNPISSGSTAEMP